MKALCTFLIVFGYILCAFGNNHTSPKWRYIICYGDSKHCIQCYQSLSVVVYEMAFPQEEYRFRLMDQLNRVRSQYAAAHRISNMKFTKWANEFEAMSAQLSLASTPIFDCSEIKTNLTDRYKILDFHTKTKWDHNKNLHKVLQLQMENFTRQMLNSDVMMTWNLYEFGCSYTFNLFGTVLSTLFRCVLYNENRRHNIEMKSDKMCQDCERLSERCIDFDLYKGLCVPYFFNETRLRLYVAPEQQNVFIVSPVVWILIGGIIFPVVCLIYYVFYKFLCDRKNIESSKQFELYGQTPSAPGYN